MASERRSARIEPPATRSQSLSSALNAIHPRPDVYAIRFLAFDSGQTTELFRDERALGRRGLAVSADEKTILFDASPQPQSELMLVENYR